MSELFESGQNTCGETPPLDAQLDEIGKTENIVIYFKHQHLPPSLRVVSAGFAALAIGLMALPRSAERTVSLRKLLESKDAAVRAALPVGANKL